MEVECGVDASMHAMMHAISVSESKSRFTSTRSEEDCGILFKKASTYLYVSASGVNYIMQRCV